MRDSMYWIIASLLTILLGYLMGSVCSAIVVCRVFNLPDPTAMGSKNPGATNVLRLAGKKYAALVLLGDMLKGTLPVAFAHWLSLPAPVLAWVALAAVLGHVYPVFFNFKGGKGVATALGSLFGLNYALGLWVLAIWIAMAKGFKYSSLASLTAMTLAPFIALYFIPNPLILLPLLIMSLWIVYMHKSNITRLYKGEEPKIGSKSEQVS